MTTRDDTDTSDSIPEGRKIHDVSEESAITLDMQLYGNAYVRGEIPEWWGGLGRILNQQLAEAIARTETLTFHRLAAERTQQ